jgi:hypothetical protein
MAIVNHFFAALFGGPPHLLRIDHAVEAGYDLTVWVVRDNDAQVPDQIRGVAGR